MNQHYEWKKATPDNLPKANGEKHLFRFVIIPNEYHTGLYAAEIRRYVENSYEIEYLAEVAPIEWPGDEQIKEQWGDFAKSPFIYGNFLEEYNNWLKQQVCNKEFNHFPFGVTPKDTSNDPNLTGNNQKSE